MATTPNEMLFSAPADTALHFSIWPPRAFDRADAALNSRPGETEVCPLDVVIQVGSSGDGVGVFAFRR